MITAQEALERFLRKLAGESRERTIKAIEGNANDTILKKDGKPWVGVVFVPGEDVPAVQQFLSDLYGVDHSERNIKLDGLPEDN